MKLNNWSVVHAGTPYTAPELQTTHVTGELCSNHHNGAFVKGDKIRTSRVVKLTRDRAWTASGSEYELGEPCQIWLDWLDENSIDLDAYFGDGYEGE